MDQQTLFIIIGSLIAIVLVLSSILYRDHKKPKLVCETCPSCSATICPVAPACPACGTAVVHVSAPVV